MADATETVEAPAADDSGNEVKIEDAGPARKRLTITVPAEIVSEKIDDSLSTLVLQAQLPGFRKGRAPRKLIERRFGSSVRTETRNQLIADAYTKAVETHKIKALGEPEGDELDEIELEPGKPLTFSVEVEVVPEFELPEVEGMKIKKPIVEVTDKHIHDELRRQRLRHGTKVEVKPGEAIAPGDRLQGRAQVYNEEGEVVNDLSEAVVGVPFEEDGPEGHVLGLYVSDMFDLFVGKKIGDSVTVETTISETDERVSLRGKKIRVDFSIDAATRITPASVEEVIDIYGMENEQELMKEITSALDQRAQQEQLAAMREQVAEQLGEQVSFDLPEKLSATQAQRQLERVRMEMLYRGMAADEVETRIAQLRSQSEERAQERLKMFFILNKLAEHYGVEVSEQEINGRIALIAAQRGVRPEQLRSQLAQAGRLQQIAMQLREHKALDRVLDTAEVEDITADEWNELVAKKQGGTETDSKEAEKTTTKKSSKRKKSGRKKSSGAKSSRKKSSRKSSRD